jgi:hypothetical protein
LRELIATSEFPVVALSSSALHEGQPSIRIGRILEEEKLVVRYDPFARFERPPAEEDLAIGIWLKGPRRHRYNL